MQLYLLHDCHATSYILLVSHPGYYMVLISSFICLKTSLVSVCIGQVACVHLIYSCIFPDHDLSVFFFLFTANVQRNHVPPGNQSIYYVPVK